MMATAAAIANPTTPDSEARCSTIQVHERDVFWGLLTDIIDPDGEDFILAQIDTDLIEVPKSLSEKMWGLMNRSVTVGLFNGQYRAGATT